VIQHLSKMLVLFDTWRAAPGVQRQLDRDTR
jgi:hypothetical protein